MLRPKVEARNPVAAGRMAQAMFQPSLCPNERTSVSHLRILKDCTRFASTQSETIVGRQWEANFQQQNYTDRTAVSDVICNHPWERRDGSLGSLLCCISSILALQVQFRF